MLTSKVVAHFGGNRSAVARAAGVSRQAVQQWGKYVPAYTAAKLAHEHIELTFDPADYATLEGLRRLRIRRTMRRTLANSRRASPAKKPPPPDAAAGA
jgi:DNA-binding XRE family transcriptional regulator